jgi:hypothetical protein
MTKHLQWALNLYVFHSINQIAPYQEIVLHVDKSRSLSHCSDGVIKYIGAFLNRPSVEHNFRVPL